MKLLVILFLLGPLFLQAQTQISGDIRIRPELRYGYRTLPSDDASPLLITFQRSRLVINHQASPIDVRFSIQDVRIWGDEPQAQQIANIAVHEAWVNFRMSENLALKAGRQEIIFDQHRLMGNLDWVMAARKHDAALLTWAPGNLQVLLGGAYNNDQNRLFFGPYSVSGNYRTLGLARLTTGGENWQITINSITEGLPVSPASDTILYRFTFGPYGEFNTGNWTIRTETYLQLGQDRQFRDINAGMFSLYTHYNVPRWQWRAGIDYLTGTSHDQEPGINNSFHTLYPTNHRYYGHIDFFLDIPTDTRQAGLQNIYSGFTYRVNDTLHLNLDLHHFSAATHSTALTSPQSEFSKSLGIEMDTWIDFHVSPVFLIRGGYSVLFPTESMVRIKGGEQKPAHWGWLMLIARPVFFDG